jgi:hypothetical protein
MKKGGQKNDQILYPLMVSEHIATENRGYRRKYGLKTVKNLVKVGQNWTYL